MLDADGKLYLCDFGVSQFFKKENDVIRNTAGTVRFMAPEAFKTGKLKVVHCRQLDIWACGVTLFNMLTNSFPFVGNTIMQL